MRAFGIAMMFGLLLALGVLGTAIAAAGVRTLWESWILSRRGVRTFGVAERFESHAGPFSVYRFLDGQGQPRVANAGRVRRYPAVEVRIVYDPRNTKLVTERPLVAGMLGGSAVALFGCLLAGLPALNLVAVLRGWY